MTINLEKETKKDLKIDYKKIADDIVKEALDVYECPYETEVNILLVDNERIHEINKDQRDIDRPTDVLSFPMLEYDQPADFSFLENRIDAFSPETGELILGDIVISIDKVKEQAKEYGHSEEREFAFLIAHSMLHLFGFDHMVDYERIDMEKRQEEILQKKGYLRES